MLTRVTEKHDSGLALTAGTTDVPSNSDVSRAESDDRERTRARGCQYLGELADDW